MREQSVVPGDGGDRVVRWRNRLVGFGLRLEGTPAKHAAGQRQVVSSPTAAHCCPLLPACHAPDPPWQPKAGCCCGPPSSSERDRTTAITLQYHWSRYMDTLRQVVSRWQQVLNWRGEQKNRACSPDRRFLLWMQSRRCTTCPASQVTFPFPLFTEKVQ